MKKMNMLIAVFAVMSAASVARAGNPDVDFDGRTSGSISFTESIRENIVGAGDITLPHAAPAVDFTGAFSPLSSGGCMVVCQFGINNDCSCKKPWWLDLSYQQDGAQDSCQPIPLGTGWYEMVRCGGNPVDWNLIIAGARGETRSAGSARMFHPGLQQKLREILMGYCNTYPEFAEVVLPMLKDEKAKIAARDGFVYIISGNSIIRIAGKDAEKAGKAGSGAKFNANLWGAAGSAAQAVIDVVEALDQYYSYPPIPDSGTANDYHGPALTVKPEDGVPVIYNNIQEL